MKKFIQILTWLGIMSVLTLIAMGVWTVVWHGSQETESLKWLQFLQTVATFLLPPVLCAWLWDSGHRPFHWLQMDKGAGWQVFALAIGIMVCAIPAIILLADLNGRIRLPESLAGIEAWMKAMEASAMALTERFLAADGIGGLLLNLGLMALLPALAEEMSFRGVLQGVLSPQRHTHVAIWVTAFIFSAIHMQFYGFIPRMMMGALFGYVFVWTGSLWVPIVMHFINNGIAVVSYQIATFRNQAFSSPAGEDREGANNIADTIGAGDTWWVGVISLVVVAFLVWILITSQDLPGYVRRTRKE